MDEAFTPAWWMERLMHKLAARQRRFELLDSYVRSNPPLPTTPNKGAATEGFEFLRRISRVNWADIIVESVVERMNVLHFTGTDATAAAEAWRVWTRNEFHADEAQMYRTKATLGEAYGLVGSPDEQLGGVPRITFEDPRQMIAEIDVVDKRTVLAALKVFNDDAHHIDRAFLYLPGEDGGRAQLHRATRERRPLDPTAAMLTPSASTFLTVEGWQWEDPTELATTSVPVVWYPNRLNLKGQTLGEFEHVIDDLDRIILLVLQRVQVAVLQAFRQRAVRGELPEKDADGNLIDYNVVLSADPGALWNLPNGVELWESSGVDLTPILESVKGDVRDLAGRTRTPLYYFYPNEGGSAEGAVTQREGLIFRANARLKETTGPHQRLMQLALEAMGNQPETPVTAVWLRPDLATLAERYDAAAKANTAGVPWEVVMTDILQFPQDRVEQMRLMRAQAATVAPAADLPPAPLASGPEPAAAGV